MAEELQTLSYNEATKRPSYNFVLALMLLVLYEGSVFLAQSTGGGQVVNGVDAMFDALLAMVPYGTWILSGLVVVIGFALFYQDRKEGVRVETGKVLLMLLESTVWAAILFFTLPMLLGKVFTPGSIVGLPLQADTVAEGTVSSRPGWLYNIGLSFGAGFYEELFFRLMLVRGMQLIAKLFGADVEKWSTTVVILLLSALIFSGSHYIGSLGDKFDLYGFVYRAIMGLIFSMMLVFRRFGITAWSHALYDVFVFTAQAFGG